VSEFDGLVAAVTGGASGIGEATARLLRERGAKVAVLDLSAPDGMRPEPVEMRPEPDEGPDLAVVTDVADDASVRAAIERVVTELGGLDILVNCAGIGAQGDVTANDDEEWLRVLNVNLMGVIRCCRAALPHLRRSSAPAIVNVGSVAATAGLPDRVLYSATKGAVVAATRAMAADHIREGIRINCVNPGTAQTPWIDRLLAKTDDPDAELAALNARQPHGRLVTADEVAGAVAYLASPRSGSTTGIGMFVDGGMQELRLRPRT
jgi:NAD(P)-dependent dehydrogenase (short-subunit alcohol dehydrogenase family)